MATKWNGGRTDWKFGISRCKIGFYIGWISNTVLTCTGNYFQYTMMNHSGKEKEKEYIHIYVYMYIYIHIYIYITESLFCTAEINTTL